MAESGSSRKRINWFVECLSRTRRVPQRPASSGCRYLQKRSAAELRTPFISPKPERRSPFRSALAANLAPPLPPPGCCGPQGLFEWRASQTPRRNRVPPTSKSAESNAPVSISVGSNTWRTGRYLTPFTAIIALRASLPEHRYQTIRSATPQPRRDWLDRRQGSRFHVRISSERRGFSTRSRKSKPPVSWWLCPMPEQGSEK